MKRIVILIVITALSFSPVFAQDEGQATTLNIVNGTTQSKLLFNTITQPLGNNCLPEFREYNYAGISGYCILDPSSSLSLENYETLENYYPTIKIYASYRSE